MRNLAVSHNQGINVIVIPAWRAEWKEYEGGGGQFLHIPFKNGEKSLRYGFMKHWHWHQSASLAAEVYIPRYK